MASAYDRLDAERAAEDAPALQAREDLIAVLGTPQGGRFIAGLIASCGVLGPSFDARAEGRRAVGLDLLRRIREAAPGSYPLIVGDVADRS
ncbi:putative phage protein p19 [uncultured Alphaproteobacteria bacterium]|uniref:Putative phage protein p19 n=1 Tax=uncultured Alphaproteobacteria bacterium TaxID=91750 RepID=A0A212KLS7_9PROT|nr:putative phage protein p19 [uncultured Alphaproteobacteria bacterium]